MLSENKNMKNKFPSSVDHLLLEPSHKKHLRADVPSCLPLDSITHTCALTRLSVVNINIGPIRFALGHVLIPFVGTTP